MKIFKRNMNLPFLYMNILVQYHINIHARTCYPWQNVICLLILLQIIVIYTKDQRRNSKTFFKIFRYKQI